MYSMQIPTTAAPSRGYRRPIANSPTRGADYVLSRLAAQAQSPIPNRPGEREYAWGSKNGQEGYFSYGNGNMLPRPKSSNRFR